jgi:outer membrane lipoprotein-sorting protein
MRGAATIAAVVMVPMLAAGSWRHRHPQAAPAAPTNLAGVLQALDEAAPKITSVSADASVADYTALVEDTTRSSGTLDFKQTKQGPMYALNLNHPAATAKKLVYREQTLYVYTPSSKQVIKYALGDKQDLLNEYLLLGMGSRGDELTRNFNVIFDGQETLGNVSTVKLTLTLLHPGNSKLTKIDLWYDTRNWIAAQQQIWQVGGDYHLVHFSNVKRGAHLGDEPFSTDFPGATVVTAK